MALDRIASLAVDIVVNARRARAVMYNFSKDTKRTAKEIAKLNKTIQIIGLAASAFLILRKAVGLVKDAVVATITAYARLETQIMDVQKIAKASTFSELAEDFFEVSKALRGVDFQTISTAMAASARAGVRAGDALNELTKSAVLLSQVSGDIDPKEAAEGLAILSINLTGSAKGAWRLANIIDKLSDSFVTTSGQITTSASRLAGFAAATNLTETELLGITAALLSTGASSTVARSSLVRLLTTLSSEPYKAAASIGLLGEEADKFFMTMRQSGRRGLIEFIKGLRKLNPSEQTRALKELGIASNRITPVIKILEHSIGLLTKGVNIAGKEADTQSSLLKKQYGIMQTTTTGLVELKKAWEEFKASLAGSGSLIEGITDALRGLANAKVGDNILTAPDTLEEVQKRITAVGAELADARREELKHKRVSEKGLAKMFPGLQEYSAFRSKQSGAAADRLKAELDHLKKIRATLLPKPSGSTQTDKDKEAKRQKDLAEQRATQVAAGKTFLGNLPNVPIAGQTALQRQLASITETIAKQHKSFSELDIQTGTMKKILADWTEAMIQSGRKLIELDKETSRKKRVEDEQKRRNEVISSLKQAAGEFGTLIGTMQEFDRLLGSDVVKKNRGLYDALKRTKTADINELIKGKQQAPSKPTFMGLTELWRSTMTGQNEERQTRLDQLNLARELLTVSGESKSVQDKMLDKLEELADPRKGRIR